MMSYNVILVATPVPSLITLNEAITPTTIHADELTEGDIIKHFTGDTWMVIREPEYTRQGITFDVLWLDVDSPDNT